jgi:hypothetical protein
VITSHLQVNLSVAMSIEEAFKLETALAGHDDPQVKALAEALRIQNATVNRLVIQGAVKPAVA